jgi:hypothetical protein
MKKRIGNMFGRLKNSARTRKDRLRALKMESLEGRQLLAADLLPDHNYLIAEDVNQDFAVTPLDALLVVNAINGRNAAHGEGEQPAFSPKVDTNGDGILSAIDAMLVINALNGEGEEGVLITYRQEITDLSGAPITNVAVGQSFRINVFVRDARDIPANPDPRLFGVYSAAMDLGVSNLELIEYKTTTDFLSGVTFGDEFLNDQGANEGGGIQIDGTTQANVVDGQTFTLDSGSGPITFEFDSNGIIGAGTEIITFSTSVFADVGNAMVGAINASSLGVTAAYNGQGVVGLPLDQVTFSAGTSNLTLSTIETEYLNEVKSFLDRSRSPDPAGELPFYSVVFEALTPGQVTFTPNGPDRPGSENLLFGDRTVIPNNMIMFGNPFNFTIISDPTGPTAVNDTLSTLEDTALTLTKANVVDTNDTSAATPPRALTLVSVSTIAGTTQGTVNGFVYTPPANFFGQDLVTYTVQDAIGLQASATVTINVTAVNDPPVAVNDSRTADEDSIDNLLTGLLANDNSGPGENDTLTITALGVPSNGGTVTIVAGGQSVNYTPAAAFVGTETFTYTISDGAATATATVSVEVEPATLPRARTDRPTFTEDSANNSIDVLLNDSANVGATKLLVSFEQPSNGTVTLDDNGTAADASDDKLVYTPNANFNGEETFTYVMNDDAVGSVASTGTVVVSVTPVNDTPVVNNDSASTNEDTAVTVDVLANDNVGPGDKDQLLSITSVSNPDLAGVSLSITDNKILVTPNVDVNGTVILLYTAEDNGTPALSASGTLTLTINPVNDDPIARPDSVNATEDTPLPIAAATLLSNDVAGPDTATDETEQVKSITGVSATSSQGGTVTLDGTTVNYTPAADFNGTDTFTYTLSDGAGGTATGTVTVNVAAVNDAPVAGASSVTAFKDNTSVIQVSVILANDSRGPADEAAQTLSITDVTATANTNGTVTLNGDGTISYTPNAGFTGSASFEYTLRDSGSGVAPNVNSSTGTVSISVEEFLPSTISGVAWIDETNDGIVDAAERFLGGVSVTLTGISLGQAIQPQTLLTLADGSYAFEDLGPGSYTVSYAALEYMVPDTHVPNSYTINIVEPGGVNDSDNNFGVLGISPSYGRILAQLASSYIIRNTSYAYNGAYFAIGADNTLMWATHLDGYEDALFSEAVLSGNQLLLTVVDTSRSVFTARLNPGQYVKIDGDNGDSLIRVLGSEAGFSWTQVDLSSPPVESAAKYLDSVDAIFAQEGWDLD